MYGGNRSGDSIIQQGNTDGWKTGVWQHVAMTNLNGPSVELYLDGVKVGSGGGNAGVGGVIGLGAQLLAPNGWARYFLNGAVDDVRVYNRVLSDDEIGQLAERESAELVGRGTFGARGARAVRAVVRKSADDGFWRVASWKETE